MIKIFELRQLVLAICGIFIFFVPTMGWVVQQVSRDNQWLQSDEYAVVGYLTNTPINPISQLQQKIYNGNVELQFDTKKGGYLESLLRQLKISVTSQILVFSKTSLQVGLISSQKPRAIYFNDNTYVAWVQNSPMIEISSMDPKLGPVFYTLQQEHLSHPRFERKTYRCLHCHDSYSLTGGGIPRYMLGSGLANKSGQLIFHEGWNLTTYQTPLNQRWGGWYVTGTHGDQMHMGNLIPEDEVDAARIDRSAGTNLTNLNKLIDTTPYLSRHSDIVALMVLGHQIHVQNLITSVNYKVRKLLHKKTTYNEKLDHDPNYRSATISQRVENIVEPLVQAMFFVNEAPLSDPITGTSKFLSEFVKKGPWDGQGRSLRQMDLTKRLFQYPLSYLIYSNAFDALPDLAKKYIYQRFWTVLTGQDKSEKFTHLSNKNLQVIREILEKTKPDFSIPRQGSLRLF